MRGLHARAERGFRALAVEPFDVLVRDERDGPASRDELAEPVQPAGVVGDARGGEHRALDVGDTRVRNRFVERCPLLVERSKRFLVLRERAVGAAHAPPRSLDVDVAVDDEVLAQELARRFARDGAAPERDHPGLGRGEPYTDCVLLDPAELRLTLLLEELGDRHSRTLLDRRVEIEQGTVEPLGGHSAERRFPRAHEPHENQMAPESVQRQPMRSTYRRHAAMKSPIASPPNLSYARHASSQATAASATTASASTAATSERSTSACAASPVSRSTDASGFIRGGSGFIAARRT